MSAAQPYSPGLENVIAATTSICTLDLENHVIVVRGYSLVEMAQKAAYEEVAYLLLYGKLPTKAELRGFDEELKSEREVPKGVYGILSTLPKGTHPLTALQVGVAALAAYDPELEDNSHEANVRKAKRLVAKTATLVANSYRILNGLEAVRPRLDLPHAENLFYMMLGREPKDEEAKFFNPVFTMYAEHELPVSTFAGRVVASSLTDMYGAVASAVAALKGPLHGRANEEAAKMVLKIGDPSRAEEFITGMLARKERVMGFGHRVYKRGIDPRAVLGRELLRELSEAKGMPHIYEIAERIYRLMEKEKALYPNIDFYAGPIFYLLGIPIELYTPIFAASRMAGWTAHVVEQHDDNRLFRPRAIYKGPFNLGYRPVEERA